MEEERSFEDDEQVPPAAADGKERCVSGAYVFACALEWVPGTYVCVSLRVGPLAGGNRTCRVVCWVEEGVWP